MVSSSTQLGFIGAGRMATALARGCVEAGLTTSQQIIASDPLAAARERFSSELPGATVTDDNQKVLRGSAAVVLAVKPQTMGAALESLSKSADADCLFVSIAAGVTLERLTGGLPSGARVVRVMPNTPSLLGMGASCYARGATATAEDGRLVERLLSAVGDVHEVQESQLDAVTGLSGSGPAFIYTVIESLAAGGVSRGLPPDLALDLAVQTTRGAAEMIRATGQTPAELREQVTSPGGTTLAGLQKLADLHGAAAIQEAVEAAADRSVELGKGES